MIQTSACWAATARISVPNREGCRMRSDESHNISFLHGRAFPPLARWSISLAVRLTGQARTALP